jgi:hypothetical protein
MHVLKNFWRSLEVLRCRAAVREQWQRLLGAEYALMQAFLRPTGQLARAVPHRDPDLLYYRVVTHGPDDHVGVCDETGERVPLSTADLIMWEVDRVAVHRAVAKVLGLVANPQPLEHLSNTWRLGQYVPLAGYSFPAVWTVQAGEAEVTQVIDRLVAMYDGPFLLLAPTGRFLRPWGEERLHSRQACFLPLDEAVALGDDGQMAATAAGKRMLAAFRERVVLESEQEEPTRAFFPTPPGIAWSQVTMHLVDGHTLSVAAGAAHGVYHYAQVGLANRKNGRPSVQWELLSAFAAGNGTLTWRSPQADRRNQKRRELLARTLKRFFRLDDDPFEPYGNGWRALFQVSGAD